MLQKDPSKRIGYRQDFSEIKAHIFFVSIRWDDLENKRIPPPFDPRVKNEFDSSNVDPSFTNEAISGIKMCNKAISGLKKLSSIFLFFLP